MRVFLDANVLFSAADADSAPRRLLEALLTHGSAVTNPHAWEEAQRNLERKRPQFVPELTRLRGRLELSARLAAPVDVGLPAQDEPVFRGAIGSLCTHLWTSDRRHFGALYGKAIRSTRVVSSIMLADELISKGWL